MATAKTPLPCWCLNQQLACFRLIHSYVISPHPGRLSTLLLPAGLDPPLEGLHLLVRPGPVARHRPVLQPLEDAVGMILHVLVGPQVEGPFHRLPIHRAEQRLDVLSEAHWLVCGGERDPPLFFLCLGGGPPHTPPPRSPRAPGPARHRAVARW